MTQAGDVTNFEQFNSSDTAIVIGGGVSGMTAALDIAEQGFRVVLVERTPSIGGVMAMLDKTFPTLDCSACILTPKLSEVQRHPNIKLMTYSEVIGVIGEAGDFKVRVLRKARKVLEDKCSGCGECIPHCPIEVPNEFDQDLGYRKAIYVGFPQSTPLVFTIDTESCIKCGMCVKSCEREAIDLDMEDQEIEIPAGAIVVATGYKLFDVKKQPRYGYGKYKNVIHSLEFERLMNAAGPTQGNLMRMNDGKAPTSVAFIQCVGGRDVSLGVPYCSRVCCMFGSKLGVMTREHHPDTKVDIYYADLRAFGKDFEQFYERAQTRFGVNYIRGRVGEVEENPENGNIILWAENIETGELLKNEHELVVLCQGLLPPTGLRELSNVMGLPLDEYGFATVNDPLVTPVDSPVPGIYVCGAVEGPKDIPDSVSAGSAAAMRATIILASGGAVNE